MDNWMAPRAFAGGNGKLATKQAKPAAQASGDSGEESGAGGAMGLLKRKRTSPPESPALPGSKKRVVEESSEVPRAAISETVEVVPGTGSTVSGDSRDSKQLLRPGQESGTAVLAAEEAVRSGVEKDGNDVKMEEPESIENISHGQRVSFKGQKRPEASEETTALTADSKAPSPVTPHFVPNHAGWFQWTKINKLERLGLPEFFSGKNTLKTPELYMEHRNFIIKKYRENPQKVLKLEDVQGDLKGDTSGAVRLFAYLDHWGLINYQATTGFAPFLSSGVPLDSATETSNGVLQFGPLTKPALANLFEFEATLAPAVKLLSPRPGPSSNLPLSSIAEAYVQESLAAPAVEYHCNSCQADCSKRRYHCQKQADFDLCPDCYSDGKFGEGMSGTDFLRMDALTETSDANGGGWSDQETLLLLEALELYGDNWTEIAEHVATKSRAQCILHFVRLPIEDPFLEDMEVPDSGITSQPPGTTVTEANGATHAKDSETPPVSKDKLHSPLGEAKEALPPHPEHDASVPEAKATTDVPAAQTTEEIPLAQKKEKETEVSVSKRCEDIKVVDSGAAPLILAAAESSGSAGPDGLIAFADAGNPVMTQVAFLAAMVGPRVAAAAAEAALKALTEEDPVGYLSVRNSFTLESSGEEGLPVSERLTGPESVESQSVASSKDPAVPTDPKAASANTEEEGKEDNGAKVTGSLDKTAGEAGAQSFQKAELKIPTSPLAAGEDVPSMVRVRNAAASALASAAVKAKLLADQEEREIQRLVAGVIENQLKKLELKLKHFSELETMLGKECEQAEKARAKVYGERARIVASRLASATNATQMQSAGATSGPHNKTSHLSSGAAQSRPAVFTFGPSGVSAPVTTQKTSSEPAPSTSIPAGSSSQQTVVPSRLPRPTPGTSTSSGVK